jgi:PDZ domain-containing secreted protein
VSAVLVAAVTLGASAVPLPLEEARPGPVLHLANRVDVHGHAGDLAIHGEYDALTVARRRVTPVVWVRHRLGIASGELQSPRSGRPPRSAARKEFADAARTAAAVAQSALGYHVTWTVTGELLLPFPVSVDSDDVGGGSGGLLIALTVFDQMAPEDLARGRRIAGTGTMSLDGSVGPVGGIATKAQAALASGADLFLAPATQAGQARAVLGATIPVVAVARFDDALAALQRG